ncbi:MAG: hypothetical protein JSS75_07915 [Bacteroidetes bacterium]|nr:hypothetical protein [Bacteroidota bacterium]
MKRYSRWLPLLVLAAFVVSCNPFSPTLDESLPQNSFGDPHTIDGYFQAFRSAYQFRDTTLYGQLLDPQFVFSYHNYDRGLDLQWGRDEEMLHTGALFANTSEIDLLWGNIIDSVGADTVYDVTRAFSLDITLTSSDVLHTDGRAVFHLVRSQASDPWKAVQWRDESNF